MNLPKIISVDDHVVEPPDLWSSRLPARDRERGPRVERRFGRFEVGSASPSFVEGDGPDARWSDVWVWEDWTWPMTAGWVALGELRTVTTTTLITYDDMRPGAFDQAARLEDMDANHVEASLCFPTVPRFCGQLFLERHDREFALTCLRLYNDWMIDEWCGGAGRGRLIPMTVIPLWDPDLAAEEVRRCADKGSHAIAFSEAPHLLGLPSIHSGAWEPLLRACAETRTVINMHIGSASKLPKTSDDAPHVVVPSLNFQNSVHALVDWLTSGVLQRHDVKIALSEGQVGWIPFVLERLDNLWHRGTVEANLRERIPLPPSQYVPGRVYGCIFDDLVGLRIRDQVGMSQIMFETDYPHADSTFPDSRDAAERLVKDAGLSDAETYAFVRGNAIECYDLGQFGISE